MAVIKVEELRLVTVAALPPMVTPTPIKNPVPVIVTEVPPTVVPEEATILVTVGVGAA